MNPEEMPKLPIISLSSELKRKERLLHLFEELEAKEKGERKKASPPTRKYTRLINDHGVVRNIDKDSIEWIRDNGENIKLRLTKQICQNLCLGDVLIMSVGHRDNHWRVLCFATIASQICRTHIMNFNQDNYPRPELLN